MLLFLYRLFKHIDVFFVVCLPIMLLGIPMVAIALCFVSDTDYKLPRLFRWWDNADLYTGRDTSVYRAVCAKGKWARYSWLVFRNPMNYFDYFYLGFVWTTTGVYVHYNPKNDDVGDGTRPGHRYIEVLLGNETYYEYYLIYKYPFAPHYCFRFRTGWKIGDNKNKKGSFTQWCLVLNPFMPYTGK